MSADDQDGFPLTSGQLQHYRTTKENPELRTAIWSAYRISGALDIDRFIDSVEILVAGHEALRTKIFERPGGELRQRVVGPPDRARLLTCKRVLSRSEDQFNRYIRHLVASEQTKEWDAGGLPFRFGLFRYAPSVHALVVGFSHTAVDGVGNEILMRDLMRIHQERVTGHTPSGPRRQRFVESALRQAAALEKRTRGVREHDFSGVPPVTQFQVGSPEPREDAGTLSRKSDFSLAGEELAALRQLADRHGCTEFHWILAAFTMTIFQVTQQDRLKISIPVNLRGTADRDVVGMYVVAVPVVIDRPTVPNDMRRYPREVGTAVLRATAMYRMESPELLDRLLVTQSERWGARCRHDLTVNYRRVSGMSRRSFARLDWSEYRARVDYSFPGVGLRIFSFEDAVDVHAVLNSGLFPGDTTNDLVEALRENLTSPDHWTRSRAPDPPGEAVALKDAGGVTVVSADTAKVEEALLRHPLVRTASVFRETGRAGETYLCAEVGVRGGLTEDSLRDHLLKLGAHSSEVLAPGRISVSPSPS
ncbi:condensation domain-containing protein [Streptomyces diastaticus]|uniref:condensation domain-containing protein n=1 Tax=Streptomyces diastaticus TaxID=1956 RepID=UPI0033D6EB0B